MFKICLKTSGTSKNLKTYIFVLRRSVGHTFLVGWVKKIKIDMFKMCFRISGTPKKSHDLFPPTHTHQFSYRLMAGPNTYGHTFVVGWVGSPHNFAKLLCLIFTDILRHFINMSLL